MRRLSAVAVALIAAALGASTPGEGQTPRIPSVETLSPDEIAARYSAQYQKCMSQGGAEDGVTSSILDCKQDELARQDQALNQIYKRVSDGATDAASRTRLVQIERGWLKAKAAMCSSEMADAGEGTASTIGQLDCELRLTARRRAYLERMKEAGEF